MIASIEKCKERKQRLESMTHFCSVITILFAVLLLYIHFRLLAALSQLLGGVIWAVYPVIGKLVYASVKGQTYCCLNNIEIENCIWVSSPYCTQVTNTKSKNMWNYQMVMYRCATLFGRSSDIYSKISPSLLFALVHFIFWTSFCMQTVKTVIKVRLSQEFWGTGKQGHLFQWNKGTKV